MAFLILVGCIIACFVLKRLLRLFTVGNFDKRYVLITGCDTGFGNLLAKRLDMMGFWVFAACLSENGADALKKVASARLATLSLDVTKEENIVTAHAYVKAALPADKGLWAVVNNAGIMGNPAHPEWQVHADYERTLAINLYGMMDVTRTFLQLLRKGQGRVVNMSSIAGRVPMAAAPYVISKCGVEAYSDCLRREMYHQGVSVHIVEPGFFKTNVINVQQMKKSHRTSFKQMDPEIQSYYGTSFMETVENSWDYLVQFSSPYTYKAVDAYIHALTAQFPKPRYKVGKDAHLLTLFRNLPEWITDWIVALFLPRPEGAK